MDFTGGISETIDIKGGKYYSDEQKSKELFKMMLKQKDNHALMCCAIGVNFELFFYFYLIGQSCFKYLFFGLIIYNRLNLKRRWKLKLRLA
jgi:hypothetical protein